MNRLFCGVYVKWDHWWFRLFNKGIAIAPLKDHYVRFSERYGRTKTWHGFGHCWEILE